MTDQPVGPHCGNNPSVQLTDGDRRAVEDFKAHLAERAAVRERIVEVLTTTSRAEWPYTPGHEKFDHHKHGDRPGHTYSISCALCTGDVERLADVLLAAWSTPAAGVAPAADQTEPDRLEEYLQFLRGQGPEPDLSALSPDDRALLVGQFEIVKALTDRDPKLPPIEEDPVARRLGLHAVAADQAERRERES
jgi:hypothetical protein